MIYFNSSSSISTSCFIKSSDNTLSNDSIKANFVLLEVSALRTSYKTVRAFYVFKSSDSASLNLLSYSSYASLSIILLSCFNELTLDNSLL